MRSMVGGVVAAGEGTSRAYAQCAYVHEVYGQLWRVIDVTPGALMTDLATLVRSPARFVAFSPIAGPQGARPPFELVGRADVPIDARALPTFRWPIHRPGSAEIIRWELWTGSHETATQEASGADNDRPILEIVHPAALWKRIQGGWRPRNEPVQSGPIRVGPGPAPEAIQFFFHFMLERSAHEAASRLRQKGWSAQIERSDVDWKVVGDPQMLIDPRTVRDEFEGIASELHGDYDGWALNFAEKGA